MALYNELIQLDREAKDLTATADARRQAREDFERRFQESDSNTQRIVLDSIAATPSTQTSLLYTYRAAVTDFSRNHSLWSAAQTFFKVAVTRLTNPTLEEEEEQATQDRGHTQEI
ncbi:hypothetical protein [Legionella lansingensis]|nr:hypothetical protein [Legionella lansingensis]